uniref:Flagellin n=1 Tax=Aureimonas altamirensis TaxID=370622 RepID=A0A0P0YY22_9HYPH|nr:flagellin [Aureimonas altamirensis]
MREGAQNHSTLRRLGAIDQMYRMQVQARIGEQFMQVGRHVDGGKTRLRSLDEIRLPIVAEVDHTAGLYAALLRRDRKDLSVVFSDVLLTMIGRRHYEVDENSIALEEMTDNVRRQIHVADGDRDLPQPLSRLVDRNSPWTWPQKATLHVDLAFDSAKGFSLAQAETFVNFADAGFFGAEPGSAARSRIDLGLNPTLRETTYPISPFDDVEHIMRTGNQPV